MILQWEVSLAQPAWYAKALVRPAERPSVIQQPGSTVENRRLDANDREGSVLLQTWSRGRIDRICKYWLENTNMLRWMTKKGATKAAAWVFWFGFPQNSDLSQNKFLD